MENFWQKIDRPVLALAPMAGVTDGAFREICAGFGADVVYSEMANVKALSYSPEKTLTMLKDARRSAPLVVQLFGSDPEFFYKAVKIVEKEIGPDGIDINFGCPAPKILKTKAGADLFQDLDLSYEVIRTCLEATKLPVSIKTRIKVGKVTVFDFWEKVKNLDIKAIMIHGRSFSQGFSGQIDIESIKKFKKIAGVPVLANGGIYDHQEAERVLQETGVAGLGLARGVMGRPWLFEEIKNSKNISKKNKQIFCTILRQAQLSQELKGDKGILEMRKHLCWYIKNLKGARSMRKKLVKVENIKDIKEILNV